MTNRSRWQWIGGSIALASAIVTLFMFTTGIQSIPALFGRSAVEPPKTEPSTSQSIAPLKGSASTAVEPVGPTTKRDAPRRLERDPPIEVQVEDERGGLHPVQVELERIVARESDTLVRLAVTNNGSENLEYLLASFNRRQPRLGARDAFVLTDETGKRHEWSGQQGAIEDMRTATVGTLCVPLPSGTKQTFDLLFPIREPRGEVTLLHVNSPKMFGYVKCRDARAVALPNFSLKGAVP